MIEELIGSLKSEVGGQLKTQTDVPNEKMDGILSVVGDVVKSTAAKELMGGNLSALTNLFSDEPNDDEANRLESNMSSNLMSELMGKLGISADQAQSIAAVALPALIGMITKKKNTSDKDDSSFLSEILGGGSKSGLGGIASDLLGGLLK